MERLLGLRHGGGARRAPLLDPCRYVREADRALAVGDLSGAVALIAQAYLAFDLCSTDCRLAKVWGRASSERNS
jgi:hypothetical protein